MSSKPEMFPCGGGNPTAAASTSAMRIDAITSSRNSGQRSNTAGLCGDGGGNVLVVTETLCSSVAKPLSRIVIIMITSQSRKIGEAAEPAPVAMFWSILCYVSGCQQARKFTKTTLN